MADRSVSVPPRPEAAGASARRSHLRCAATANRGVSRFEIKTSSESGVESHGRLESRVAFLPQDPRTSTPGPSSPRPLRRIGLDERRRLERTLGDEARFAGQRPAQQPLSLDLSVERDALAVVQLVDMHQLGHRRPEVKGDPERHEDE